MLLIYVIMYIMFVYESFIPTSIDQQTRQFIFTIGLHGFQNISRLKTDSIQGSSEKKSERFIPFLFLFLLIELKCVIY